MLVLCLIFSYGLFLYMIGLFATLVLAATYIYTKKYNDDSENLKTNRYWAWFHGQAAAVVELIGRKLFSYKVVYHEAMSDGNDLKHITTSTKDAIFCASPHGLYPIASIFHLAQPDYKRVRPGVHRNTFSFPGLRDFVLWCGGFSPTKDNIREVITKSPVYINIGGSRETLAIPSEKKHRGILDIAYDEGKLIIPVIHQGQEDVLQHFSFGPVEKIRLFFMDYAGYAFPTFPIPRIRPLTTHIYDPINPKSYESCDAFVNAYYTRVEGYKAMLGVK